MYNSITKWLIFSTLFLISCDEKPFQEETKEFGTFLNTNFKQTLFIGKTVFLLFPFSICKNCFLLDGRDYDTAFLEKLNIISSVDSTNFHHFDNIYLDKNDKTIRLSFVHYQCQIVIVDKGKIVNIIPLNNYEKQLDSLQKVFTKLY